MFLFMLVMAGLGIDMMRYEMERTHLQATLDSAVLAGAGAPIGSEVDDVKAIIEDYFAKNDMSKRGLAGTMLEPTLARGGEDS